jgi:TetR/AcrR family transcriptional repressor of nem operon
MVPDHLQEAFALSHCETRDRIIEAAQNLMQQRGYAGTSVENICRATGVTKGAFFHHFPDKETLAAEALRGFADNMAANLANAPYTRIEDPRERLWGYVDYTRGLMDDKKLSQGCLVALFTLERASREEPFAAICRNAFLGWENLTSSLIADAAESANRRLDAQGLSRQFVALVEGSILLYKAHDDIELYRANIDHFRDYLHCLLEGTITTTAVCCEPLSH